MSSQSLTQCQYPSPGGFGDSASKVGLEKRSSGTCARIKASITWKTDQFNIEEETTMTKFNLAALAAISIALSVIPIAIAHQTGVPHREASVSRKATPAISTSRTKKIASKNKASKSKGQKKMDPNMKM